MLELGGQRFEAAEGLVESGSCHVILAEDSLENVRFEGIDGALGVATAKLRLFGKPEIVGKRRMGVGLALGASIDEARAKARKVAAAVKLAG